MWTGRAGRDRGLLRPRPASGPTTVRSSLPVAPTGPGAVRAWPFRAGASESDHDGRRPASAYRLPEISRPRPRELAEGRERATPRLLPGYLPQVFGGGPSGF